MTHDLRQALELADWRRRVAELYAGVRAEARVDPAAAHARWCAVRESLYREHPASPLPAARRAGFRALHFPYDPALRFDLPVEPAASLAQGPRARAAEPAVDVAGGSVRLPASAGLPLRFERVGWLNVPFADGARRLALFWLPEYAGGLFLPFRDGTGGRETYGGGRYLLDSAKGADLGGDPGRGTLIVDFNFAFQPSCAWDPAWECPLTPPENRLDREILAGERLA